MTFCLYSPRFCFSCWELPISRAANACGPRNKVTAMLGNILLIIVSVLLFGYLFYALLKPEKF